MIVGRTEWGARPPRSAAPPIRPSGITIHWEGPPMGSYGHYGCKGKVREIQRFHMDNRGWSDVAYTALVCRHGDVFVGRGPNRRTAANGSNAGNTAHLAVCVLMGQGDTLAAAALAGVRDAIEWLRREGAGHEVRPHSYWRPTACPGDELRHAIAAGVLEPVPYENPYHPEADDMRLIHPKTGPDSDAWWLQLGHRVFPILGDELRQFQEAGIPVSQLDEPAWDRVKSHADVSV